MSEAPPAKRSRVEDCDGGASEQAAGLGAPRPGPLPPWLPGRRPRTWFEVGRAELPLFPFSPGWQEEQARRGNAGVGGTQREDEDQTTLDERAENTAQPAAQSAVAPAAPAAPAILAGPEVTAATGAEPQGGLLSLPARKEAYRTPVDERAETAAPANAQAAVASAATAAPAATSAEPQGGLLSLPARPTKRPTAPASHPAAAGASLRPADADIQPRGGATGGSQASEAGATAERLAQQESAVANGGSCQPGAGALQGGAAMTGSPPPAEARRSQGSLMAPQGAVPAEEAHPTASSRPQESEGVGAGSTAEVQADVIGERAGAAADRQPTQHAAHAAPGESTQQRERRSVAAPLGGASLEEAGAVHMELSMPELKMLSTVRLTKALGIVIGTHMLPRHGHQPALVAGAGAQASQQPAPAPALAGTSVATSAPAPASAAAPMPAQASRSQQAPPPGQNSQSIGDVQLPHPSGLTMSQVANGVKSLRTQIANCVAEFNDPTKTQHSTQVKELYHKAAHLGRTAQSILQYLQEMIPRVPAANGPVRLKLSNLAHCVSTEVMSVLAQLLSKGKQLYEYLKAQEAERSMALSAAGSVPMPVQHGVHGVPQDMLRCAPSGHLPQQYTAQQQQQPPQPPHVLLPQGHPQTPLQSSMGNGPAAGAAQATPTSGGFMPGAAEVPSIDPDYLQFQEYKRNRAEFEQFLRWKQQQEAAVRQAPGMEHIVPGSSYGQPGAPPFVGSAPPPPVPLHSQAQSVPIPVAGSMQALAHPQGQVHNLAQQMTLQMPQPQSMPLQAVEQQTLQPATFPFSSPGTSASYEQQGWQGQRYPQAQPFMPMAPPQQVGGAGPQQVPLTPWATQQQPPEQHRDAQEASWMTSLGQLSTSATQAQAQQQIVPPPHLANGMLRHMPIPPQQQPPPPQQTGQQVHGDQFLQRRQSLSAPTQLQQLQTSQPPGGGGGLCLPIPPFQQTQVPVRPTGQAVQRQSSMPILQQQQGGQQAGGGQQGLLRQPSMPTVQQQGVQQTGGGQQSLLRQSSRSDQQQQGEQPSRQSQGALHQASISGQPGQVLQPAAHQVDAGGSGMRQRADNPVPTETAQPAYTAAAQEPVDELFMSPVEIAMGRGLPASRSREESVAEGSSAEAIAARQLPLLQDHTAGAAGRPHPARRPGPPAPPRVSDAPSTARVGLSLVQDVLAEMPKMQVEDGAVDETQQAPATSSRRPATNGGRRMSGGGGSKNHLLSQLRKILSDLTSYDSRAVFRNPVDLKYAPNYEQYVKQPICLRDIREKLEKGRYEVHDPATKALDPGKTVASFRADLDLMVQNCIAYNPPNNAYHTYGRQMAQEIERRFRSRFGDLPG